MTRLSRIALVSCVVLAAAWSQTTRAEVSAGSRRSSDPVDTMVMTNVITDGVDPIPQARWELYRNQAANAVLNPLGDVRGDGPPSIAYRPNGSPIVVWAYKNAGDHDIAFAQWTASGWGATEFLTSGPEDERDPSVYLEANGTIHVAWWVDKVPGESDEIYKVTRGASTGDLWLADFTEQLPVAPEPLELGRRPSLGRFAGVMRMVYERDSVEPGMAQDVMIRRLDETGTVGNELLASTARTESLEPMLHKRAGKIWVDWKHGAAQFGYVELSNGSWQFHTASWTDTSWVGTEMLRNVIRRNVIQGIDADLVGPQTPSP